MTLNLDDASALLAKVAERFHADGRPATAAGVKAQMRQASFRDFDEAALGFSTFREFLVDAEARGVVDLHEGRFDVLITPPGLQPALEPSFGKLDSLGRQRRRGADRSDSKRIRRDVWTAFIDWTPGVARVLDRHDGVAVVLPERPGPREDASQRALREAIGQSPERFVRIDPISFDEQLGWMHEFAAEQQSPIREQLQVALGSARPVRDFTAQIRQVPALSTAWNVVRVRRAADWILRWAAANQVALDPFDVPSAPSVDRMSLGRTFGVVPDEELDDVQRLRAVLHQAIDRMPPEELAALRLPVGYLLGKPGR